MCIFNHRDIMCDFTLKRRKCDGNNNNKKRDKRINEQRRHDSAVKCLHACAYNVYVCTVSY